MRGTAVLPQKRRIISSDTDIWLTVPQHAFQSQGLRVAILACYRRTTEFYTFLQKIMKYACEAVFDVSIAHA